MRDSVALFQHSVQFIGERYQNGPRVSTERPMEVRINQEDDQDWAEKIGTGYQIMVEQYFNCPLVYGSTKRTDDNNYAVLWFSNSK